MDDIRDNQAKHAQAAQREWDNLIQELRTLESILHIQPVDQDANQFTWSRLHERIRALRQIAAKRISAEDFEPHQQPTTMGQFLEAKSQPKRPFGGA